MVALGIARDDLFHLEQVVSPVLMGHVGVRDLRATGIGAIRREGVGVHCWIC